MITATGVLTLASIIVSLIGALYALWRFLFKSSFSDAVQGITDQLQTLNTNQELTNSILTDQVQQTKDLHLRLDRADERVDLLDTRVAVVESRVSTVERTYTK